MSDEMQRSEHPELSSALGRCIPRLQELALNLDTYGDAQNAARLHEVIKDLKEASPNETSQFVGSMDLVVNGTFKVSRQQVANTLWHAFTGDIPWFTIAERVPPPRIKFRSIDQTCPGIVDYPLNEGGAIIIRTIDPTRELFELRLEKIVEGLEALACHYPRHFADVVNENADAVTADALLQCCIFGELLYS